MSERDNPTMQIAKTALEVRRSAAIKAAERAQLVGQQVRFGSNSAPGIGRQTEWKDDELGYPTRQVGDVEGVDPRPVIQTEWKDDELGNPTRQVGDVEGVDPRPVIKRKLKLAGDLKWQRPRSGNGRFQKGVR